MSVYILVFAPQFYSESIFGCGEYADGVECPL